MKVVILFMSLFFSMSLCAQQSNRYVMEGNNDYRKGDFGKAIEAYKNALRSDPKNDAAQFNLANALQRQNETSGAEKLYDDITQSKTDNALKAKSFYNKGLVFIKEKKLQEASFAFMQALAIDPNDNDTRENLQFVLNAMKKQNPPKQNSDANNQRKPEPEANKDLIEQKLNELRNQERQLQKRLQKLYGHGQPEKDW